MAETDIALADGATEAPPSPKGDQISELSIEDIAEAVASRIYRDDQSQADKAVAALRKELLPYLEDSKRTSALVRALARGDVLTEEQMESMDKARTEAARVQRLEAEKAQLEAEKAEALEQISFSSKQIDEHLENLTADNLLEYAKEQGYLEPSGTWADLVKSGILPKERIASRGDERGLLRYEREGKASIRKAADAKSHDEEPPTNIAQVRGAGTAGPEDAYRKWLKGEGPRPADAEIDRLTAAYG